MVKKIKLFFSNLFYIFFTNQKYKQDTVYSELLDLKIISNHQKQIIQELQNQLVQIKQDTLKLKIINLPPIISNKYVDEIEYIRNTQGLPVFPYKQIKSINHVKAYIDEKTNMPYVLHNNKKLYFPKIWSIEQSKQMYKNYIEVENLLGGNFTEKSPHQYQTKDFCVQQDDVVFDVGAAEGLFALDVVDKAKHIYIIEPSEIWQEPLKATFEVYSEKVTIIQKFISNTVSNTHIRLKDLLEKYLSENIFLKLDIEGFEYPVLKDSQELLLLSNNLKIACCTYHRYDDSHKIELLFKQLDYNYHFSEGYMIFIYDTNQQEPFFRHGLIRAQK
jgi:hypothetical protein